MSYRLLAVAAAVGVAAAASLQIGSAAAQSVYVAPGGVYIGAGAGPVYVTPTPPIGAGAYVPPAAAYLDDSGYGNGYGPVGFVEPGYEYEYGPGSYVEPRYSYGFRPGPSIAPRYGYGYGRRPYAAPRYGYGRSRTDSGIAGSAFREPPLCASGGCNTGRAETQ
jgi:hypothetical protein